MKVNAAIIRKNEELSTKNAMDKNTVTAFLSIAFGIIFGCIIFMFSAEAHKSSVGELFINFSTDFSNKTPVEIFSGLLFTEISIIILVLIFGASIIGKPFVCAMSALKGSGLGFLASYLYCTYGLKGLEYCLLIFYPGKIVMLLSLMLACKNALGFCDSLKSAEHNLRQYSISSLIILLINSLSCLIEFVLILSFSSLFSF